MADARAATLGVVGDVLATRDVAPLAAVLAADVRWDGRGLGVGCRSPADVLATMRDVLCGPVRYTLQDARLHGDQAVLHLVLAGGEADGDEAFFVLTLDDDGMITALARYASRAAVEHDLAIRAGGTAALARGPAPAVRALVPFVHVAEMARSLAFYGQLGFAVVNTHEPEGRIVWAFLERERAALMLAQADAPIDPRAQAVLFYLYAGDLAGLRDRLVAAGLAPGEIVDGTPGPKEQMRVTDPDGYVLMIARIETDN